MRDKHTTSSKGDSQRIDVNGPRGREHENLQTTLSKIYKGIVKERDIEKISLFPIASKTILVRTNGKPDNNDVRRLIDLFKFPTARFFYQFRPHGICILTHRQELIEFIFVGKLSHHTLNTHFNTVFNTGLLTRLVDDADQQSNGLFRKSSRLISFWNYKLQERDKLAEKNFKSVQLLILSLNWFNEVDEHPTVLRKFIFDIFCYALKHLDEPIILSIKGTTFSNSAVNCKIINPVTSKRALEQAIGNISEGNWLEVIPGIKHEDALEAFSNEIKADNDDDQRINHIIDWLTPRLDPLMKRVSCTGSLARGTAIKGYSDIDLLLILNDHINWGQSKEIELALKNIFMLLMIDSRVRLQRHSIFVETGSGVSFDLVPAKESTKADDLGYHLFEIGS